MRLPNGSQEMRKQDFHRLCSLPSPGVETAGVLPFSIAPRPLRSRRIGGNRLWPEMRASGSHSGPGPILVRWNHFLNYAGGLSTTSLTIRNLVPCGVKTGKRVKESELLPNYHQGRRLAQAVRPKDTALRAPDVDPVLAAQRHRMNRILDQVIAQLKCALKP
jgi:hypothetical protein